MCCKGYRRVHTKFLSPTCCFCRHFKCWQCHHMICCMYLMRMARHIAMQLSKCNDFMLWDHYLICSSNIEKKKKSYSFCLNYLHSFQTFAVEKLTYRQLLQINLVYDRLQNRVGIRQCLAGHFPT